METNESRATAIVRDLIQLLGSREYLDLEQAKQLKRRILTELRAAAAQGYINGFANAQQNEPAEK